MKLNLKALGLALMAAFAMSAVAATGAQAEEPADFWAAEYPAVIDATGEEGANSIHTFVSSGQDFTCGTGGVPAVHGEAELNEEASTLTGQEIKYTACHTVVLGVTFPVTVDMNSCDYLFHAGTKIAGGSTGTVSIDCAEDGDEITVTVFNSNDPNHEGPDRCVIHIEEQTAGGHVTYTNKIGPNGKEAITADVDVTVHSTKTDTNTLGCNNHETDATADYDGVFWAEATNSLGEFIHGGVTGTP